MQIQGWLERRRSDERAFLCGLVAAVPLSRPGQLSAAAGALSAGTIGVEIERERERTSLERRYRRGNGATARDELRDTLYGRRRGQFSQIPSIPHSDAHSPQDLEELWVGERETVREVKRRVSRSSVRLVFADVVSIQIRFLRPGLSPDGRPRRLRLIQLGRLLTDGVALVPYTIQLLSRRAKLVEQQQSLVESSEAFIESLEAVGREIGVSVREKPEKDVKGKGKQKGKDVVVDEDERVWLHCSVGEAMEDDEIEGERVQVRCNGLLASNRADVPRQTSQITPLQGFDKLRDAGFSEQEIATMREEFRANAGHAPIDGGGQRLRVPLHAHH